MRFFACSCLVLLTGCLLVSESAWAGSDDPKPPRLAVPKPVPFSQQETAALALVKQNLPELLQVLNPLKASNLAEYRKAIGEIATEAAGLKELQAKNPTRAALALETWKTRYHAELLAAQLAGSPTPERAAQLRTAIEARVEADLRRHQYEADQAEAGLVRARENLAKAEAHRDKARDNLNRLEKNREARVEARFRALQPKKIEPTISKPSAGAGLKSIVMPITPLPATLSNAEPRPSAPRPDNSPLMPSTKSIVEGNP